MKIRVEFLISHSADLCEVGRVPCIGESVSDGLDGVAYEVLSVIHILNAVHSEHIVAIVRVR